jgi:phage tail sheath gpL-like
MPDSNTAAVTGVTATTAIGSNVLTAVSSVAGINAGASLAGTGIPAGAVVESVTATTITMSVNATVAGTLVALTIQNNISQASEIIASACAAVMMNLAFPYNPLQGVTIGGLVPQRIFADRIDINPNGASEQALVAGLSPLYVQPGGAVGFVRTRTTYNLLPDGVSPVTAYFDWQDLVVLNDFKEVCYQITQNPPFNNNPGGTKASARIAALLKDEILREAKAFEDLNAFQGVLTLASQFQVLPSTTSKGRFDFKIPVNVIPGLYVIAGNIQAVSGLGDFTL